MFMSIIILKILENPPEVFRHHWANSNFQKNSPVGHRDYIRGDFNAKIISPKCSRVKTTDTDQFSCIRLEKY